MNISLWFLAIYIAVFILMTFKAGEFQWLWASILLWLGFGFIGAYLLPYVWSITHLSTIYFPQFYMTLASIFFFINHWKRVSKKSGWQAINTGGFVSLFAVSNMLLTFSLIILLALVWSRYPTGLTPYLFSTLLQMYVFNPIHWICMQAVLMIIFYIHRHYIQHQPVNYFSSRQLQLGLFLSLVFQVAYVIQSISMIRY